MAFTFQIKNLQEVLKDFDKLSVDVKQGVADELTITANEIVNMAKTLAPVDDGNLRANIAVVQRGEQGISVESGAEYSAYVEFGTGTLVDVPSEPENLAAYAIQFKGAGIRKVNLPARPFFFPAINAQTAELPKRLKEIIEEAAQK